MMISPGGLLRIILIVLGVFMFAITLGSLAKRKMNESFCLAWGVISVSVVLAGILLRPSGWREYISGIGLVLILVIIISALYAVYFVSLKISELSRKNQELAIQVSMLNQENERILHELSELIGKDIRDL